MTKYQNSKIIKNKGFTLVEVITVVFLGSVIIMAAYAVYLASYKSYKNNTEIAELTQNARIALERTSREIRQTKEIIASPSSAEIIFQDGHNTTPIQYIDYYQSGTDLNRRLNHYYFDLTPDVWEEETATSPNGPLQKYEGTPQIVAQEIQKVEFTRDPLNQSIVTIYIEVTNGAKTYQFETKTTARNI